MGREGNSCKVEFLPLMKGEVRWGLMSSEFNKSEMKNRRRYLRKNTPEVEKLPWKKIRNRGLDGLRFRRQYSVLTHLGFLLSPVQIGHRDHRGCARRWNTPRTDKIRKEKIESLGMKIFFYTNIQVREEMEGVLQDVLSNLPQPPPL